MSTEDLDALLGIDRGDPVQRLACDLTAAGYGLIDVLVKIREDSGMSRADVAGDMGATVEAIAALESASSDPRLSTLHRYALAIGATITHTATRADHTSGEPR